MSQISENVPLALEDVVVSDLLGAYFGQPAPDRMIEDVLYKVVPPGHLERNYTVRLYLKASALTLPAIMLKGKGPSYLEAHSIDEIAEMLRKFVYRSYSIIWRETQKEVFDGPVVDLLSEDCKAAFANELKRSSIFQPSLQNTAFPITPLIVKSDFESELFSLIDVHSLTEGSATSLCQEYLDSDEVGGWLIVKAASVKAAKRDRRVILGALALAMDSRNRHSFTLRDVVSGYLQFPSPTSIVTATSGPHTPPIGCHITVSEADAEWLKKLPTIISRSSALSKRHSKALEYYYRAWFMDESDRCFLLFMALDAVFGQDGLGFAKGMKSGVVRTLSENIDEKRLDGLLAIRNVMLHGAAPDLFASSRYLEYARTYSCDPSTDIQLLVSKCLRKHIFGNDFRPQDDPNSEVIQFARAQGLIPSEPESAAIVSEWP